MAENIVHLVLARLPGRAPGIKGISLFIVPKFLPECRRRLGARNAHHCAAAWSTRWASTPTPPARWCWTAPSARMVGEPNKGMQAMFVMMNAARLGVGNQSLGLTEVAYQNAVAYARTACRCARCPAPRRPKSPADPIIVHPTCADAADARAYAEAARAGDVLCALLLDKIDHSARREGRAPDAGPVAADAHRQGLPHRQRLDQATTLHAGLRRPRLHPEWGMEQFVRDARINMIYEGTNTIQSPGPAGPQGAGRQRRHAEEVRQARGALVEEKA